MMDLSFIPDDIPQRQDSLVDQLVDLRRIANLCGLYDAADLIDTQLRVQRRADELFEARYEKDSQSR